MSDGLWTEYRSLASVLPVPGLVEGWLHALRTLPGRDLLIEMGEDLPGAYLRTYGPGEVGPISREGTFSPIQTFPIAPPAPLSPFPGECFAPGRLVWRAEEGVPGEVSMGFPATGCRWGVQALFRDNGEDGFAAHIRLACAGPAGMAEEARDRIGVRLAVGMGAVFEPWVPGSPAAEDAWEEWRTRTLGRFHSGPFPAPSIPALARGWVAPPLPRRRETDPGRCWRLGWPWNRSPGGSVSSREVLRHIGILGMTGSGKTQYLAAIAGEAARLGTPFALFDLQGDLAPAALTRMPPERREALVVVDGSRPWGAGRVGVDVLDADRSDRSEDLVSAELLAALRPVGSTGEEYWGPRMERVLDSCVRSVWQAGGNLGDVASILFDPVHQAEVFAPAVQNERLGDFLGALPALQRRQPDYLASSQNRLSHLALSRVVAALVSPAGRSLDMAGAIAQGRSIAFYLPKGVMGEGPALFVANLLLANLYLTLGRSLDLGREEVRLVAIVDEAQNFSPVLLRTLLENGRKFGLATALATQSVERLEGMVGASTIATLGTVVLLRTPPPSSAKAAALLAPAGIRNGERDLLEGTLATLADHTALVRAHGTGTIEGWNLPPPVPVSLRDWQLRQEGSVHEFGDSDAEGEVSVDRRVDQTLLEIASGSVPAGVRSAVSEPDAGLSFALRRGWVVPGPEGKLDLSPSGWVRLGARAHSQAPKESREHTRLVLAAFRLFARRGIRLEVPEQGRFDRQVPDAMAYVVSPEERARASPAELAALLRGQEGGWLWRLGRGRNIHVEAEVSSLRDKHRLERSLRKATKAGAHLLFLTGTSSGGRRLRSFLKDHSVGPKDATVWVLRERPTGSMPEGG